jgi:hypothetical protein
MKQVLFFLLVFISCNGFSQSVKIRRCDSLEVMTKDLNGKMTWNEAKRACQNLGDGWRLPTIQELYFMYDKRDEIGGLVKDQNSYYWSSDEDEDYGVAGYFRFNLGTANYNYKNDTCYVRAVRDLK